MAVGVVVLLVAGCSTSEKKTLTSAALSKAMPTAQDVGAGFTREALETAAKSCEAVPFSDGSTKGTIAFTLKPSTGVGDRADALELVLEVSEPLSLTIHGHGIFAKRGDVGMCVGLEGFDGEDHVTPIDRAQIDEVARALDQKIKDAQG